ncbi:MAG: alpha/beta fold hydrolase [Ectothiorhodospiraceae bacterium]|nr:alpha/beta fold hydrolase [Ectothiorhodospiraceae bacterium]
MPYVRSNGLRIHYRVQGDGPPVVMQHGFSDSLQGWFAAGWVRELAAEFTLILIDARGHGASSKPHEARLYGAEHRVSDVLCVLDAEHITQCHYFGYSMGGWIGLNVAALAPERLSSLVLGGIHPYGQNMHIYRAGVTAGLDSWARQLTAAGAPLFDPQAAARILGNDGAALRAAVAEDRPPVNAFPAMHRLPTLLLAGDADPLLPDMERFARQLGTARLVVVPRANHVQAILDVGYLVPHVVRFLRDAHPCMNAPAFR